MVEVPRQNEGLSANASAAIRAAADMDAEDLRTLYENIDEALAFWNVLYNDAVAAQDEYTWQSISLTQVGALSDWLKMDSAPLYPSAGAGGARGLIYRLLNLPLKLFGTPQIRFNRQLRDYLHHLLQTLQQVNQKDAELYALVAKNTESIRALEAENAYYRQEIDALSQELAALRADRGRGSDDPAAGKRG